MSKTGPISAQIRRKAGRRIRLSAIMLVTQTRSEVSSLQLIRLTSTVQYVTRIRTRSREFESACHCCTADYVRRKIDVGLIIPSTALMNFIDSLHGAAGGQTGISLNTDYQF